MKTADFDYDLPESYIAQQPAEPRDSARLMVIDRASRSIVHRTFRDIGDYFAPDDLLVANQSRVIPARLYARKVPTGGRVELLLLSREDDLTWECLVKGRKTPVGTRLALLARGGQTPVEAIEGEVIEWTPAGGRLVRWARPIEPLLDELGTVPLPPYIRQPISDPDRYQTVYARAPGSVAAPTAGLHFTPELLLSLRERGVEIAFVDLDVGLDTFRPVEAEEVKDHRIHSERCRLSAAVARQVNRAKLAGRRVVAVGTTTVRVLETAALLAEGRQSCARGSDLGKDAAHEAGTGCGWQTVAAFEGQTDLFIYPGYRFRVVDALITNFHLPRSSLLMLVSAFADRELILGAYERAKEEGYRFYSFGDAMLIL